MEVSWILCRVGQLEQSQLAAVRMLKAAFISVVSASLGGTSTFSQALIECGEAIFGMLIAAAAIPLAAWFLGTC